MPLEHPPRGSFREWLEPVRLKDMDTGVEAIRKRLKPGDRFVLKTFTQFGPKTILEICKDREGEE